MTHAALLSISSFLKKHDTYSRHWKLPILLCLVIVISGIVLFGHKKGEPTQALVTLANTPLPHTNYRPKVRISGNYTMTKVPASVLKFQTNKRLFTPQEVPTFTVQVRGLLAKNTSWQSTIAGLVAKDAVADDGTIPQLDVTIMHTDRQLAVPAAITRTSESTVAIHVADGIQAYTPGKYTVIIKSGDRNITQDFTWGVLAINTDKSVYEAGQRVQIGMALLDDYGRTKCLTGESDFEKGKVWLSITAPNGTKTQLSTDNGMVTGSKNCFEHSVTNEADFQTNYQVQGEGRYLMHLEGENQNGKKSIDDYFEVHGKEALVVKRTSLPTRIYPLASYTNHITITTNQAFTGTIVEKTPAFFDLHCTDCEITGNKLAYSLEDLDRYTTGRYLTWQVSWGKNETHVLTYTFTAPTISPEFYLLGPLVAVEKNATEPLFQETRSWQIASDATKTWVGGTSSSWNDGTNWNPSGVPSGTSNVAYSSGAVNCNIDATASVADITMSSTYSGTVTQTSTFTITTSGANGFTQSVGTFTGGSGDITLTAGRLNITGGTHTSTTGNITIDTTFTYSAGTFTNNATSIAFTGTATASTTCSSNVGTNWKLSKTGGGTFTNGSGCTISFSDVSGTSSGGISTLTNNGGTITLPASQTLTITGITNTGTFTNNLTTTTLTGAFSNTGTYDMGTSHTINVSGNWTTTSGTFTATTPTINFNGTTTQTINCSTYLTGAGTYNIAKTGAGGALLTISAGCTLDVDDISGTTTNSIGAFTNSGTFILESGAGTLPISGTLTNTGTITNNATITATVNYSSTAGILNNNASGIISINRNWTENAASVTTNTGTINFLDINSSDTNTWTCGTASNLGTVVMNKPNSGTMTPSGTCVVGSFTRTAGLINNPGSTATLKVQGDFSAASTTNIGGANWTVSLEGSTNTNLTFTATSTTFISKFQVNKSSNAKVTIHASSNAFVVTTQTCVIAAGIFDIHGKNFTCGGTFTIQNGGTWQLYGTETYTSPTANAGSTVIYNGDGDSASDAISLANIPYGNLTINSTDGSSDTFTLGASSIAISGNVSITGGSVKFTAGNTYAISGTFTAVGTSGDHVVIRSTSNGQKWFINNKGVSSASYLTVTDSGCGESANDILLSATSTNGGNNEFCWRFTLDQNVRIQGTMRVQGGVRMKR